MHNKSLVLTIFCWFSTLWFVICFKSERIFKNSKLTINNDHVKMNISGDSVAFFALGDWGGLPVYPYRTVIEKKVSSELTHLAEIYNTSFQLAIGDNFYTTGVNDVDDKRFQETYEDVFDSKVLKNTPWFMALGNHDHYGNPEAQIQYTNKSNRWILPSYNYTISIKTNNGRDDFIEILVIDTVLMCGNSGSDFEKDEDLKKPRFRSLKEKLIGEDYFRSVEKRLNKIGNSSVPYVLVVGHFPVWSIAEHGPTQCLVDRLRPLLHKNNVTAYLCGHDHNLQHLFDNYLNQTVNYFLSGASNFMDTSEAHKNDVPVDSLKFHWADGNVLNGGFVLFKATSNNMTVTYFETDDIELYQTVIYPRTQSKK